MSNLISVRQAEQEAGVTKQHIISLIKEGIISGQLVGKQYVIDRASFDAWLAKRKEKQEQGSSTQA